MMLRISNLYKNFGDLTVLKGIDLSVKKGQAVAILGPSGTGKSTFLRCINFLETPDKGIVEIDDAKVDAENYTKEELRELRSKSGMVFQNYNLFKNKTALQNLTLPLTDVLKMPKEEAVERAMDLLKEVGLEDKKDSFPSRLSGGQQQRIGIARAMALNPKLLLFDEPTSSLDPKLVNEVLDVIKKLIHRHNTTMLIVTHEMKFAREAADRIIFMDNGKIIEDSRPEDFFMKPATQEAKNFLNLE